MHPHLQSSGTEWLLWDTCGSFHKAQRKELGLNDIFSLVMEMFKYKQRIK